MQISGHNLQKILIQPVGGWDLESICRSSQMCRQDWEPLYERSAEEADRTPFGHVEKHVCLGNFYYIWGS